jgi:hypothetical protein
MMNLIPDLTAYILLVLAVLLAPLSCSRDSAEKDAAPDAEAVVQSLQEEKVPGPVLEDTTHPELPASGEVLIRRSGATVTVMANQVSTTGLLRRLSQTFGFELELLEFEDRAAGVYAVDTTLGNVLEQVLEGIPYAVRYGVESGRSRLVWLAVGEKAGKEIARSRREEESQRDDEREEERRKADELEEDEEKKRQDDREEEEGQERSRPLRADEAERRDLFLAGRADREAVRMAQTFEDLESRDPETRQDAIQMLDPETPTDLNSLANAVAYDKDFRVRVAAVEQLELSGSRTAVEAITGALWDPEAEVVVAAVKALRLLGDTNTVPMVEPLLAHENREVRDRARELVELLQEREPSE